MLRKLPVASSTIKTNKNIAIGRRFLRKRWRKTSTFAEKGLFCARPCKADDDDGRCLLDHCCLGKGISGQKNRFCCSTKIALPSLFPFSAGFHVFLRRPCNRRLLSFDVIAIRRWLQETEEGITLSWRASRLPHKNIVCFFLGLPPK